MQKKNRLLLALVFNLGWFGCVIMGSYQWNFAVFFFPALSWFSLHQLHVNLKKLWTQLFVFLLVGIIFDSIMSFFGFIIFSPELGPGLFPLWLVSLWLVFVAFLPVLYDMLKANWFLAAALGALTGPLSYKSGSLFGVLFLKDNSVLLYYSLFWCLYLPLSIKYLHQHSFQNKF